MVLNTPHSTQDIIFVNVLILLRVRLGQTDFRGTEIRLIELLTGTLADFRLLNLPDLLVSMFPSVHDCLELLPKVNLHETGITGEK